VSAPLVTIVVVPREQFGRARLCLDALRDRTDVPHALVYVDGNAPAALARELAAREDLMAARISSATASPPPI